MIYSIDAIPRAETLTLGDGTEVSLRLPTSTSEEDGEMAGGDEEEANVVVDDTVLAKMTMRKEERIAKEVGASPDAEEKKDEAATPKKTTKPRAAGRVRWNSQFSQTLCYASSFDLVLYFLLNKTIQFSKQFHLASSFDLLLYFCLAILLLSFFKRSHSSSSPSVSFCTSSPLLFTPPSSPKSTLISQFLPSLVISHISSAIPSVAHPQGTPKGKRRRNGEEEDEEEMIDQLATKMFGDKMHYVTTDVATAKRLRADNHIPVVDGIISGITGADGHIISSVS